MTDRCAEITVFTKSGGPLSKHIELIDGKIANDSSSCRMAKGSARRVKIDLANMASLADLINGFSPKEAYAIGRLKHGLPDRVRVVESTNSMASPGSSPAPRTISSSSRASPVLFCKTSTSKAYLRTSRAGSKTRAASGTPCAPSCPRSRPLRASCALPPRTGCATRRRAKPIQAAADSMRPSRSSTPPTFPASWPICTTVCGSPATAGASVSAAGSFLERSLVDKACGSPERLIFEGPPIIEPPLEQAPRLAVAHEGEILDTKIACPPLTDAEKAEVRETQRRRESPP